MTSRAFLFAGLLCTLTAGPLLANTDHLNYLRTQFLQAPDDGRAEGDLAGSAVAMSGEWAVIGAPGDDSARMLDEGSAYILRRENDTWKIHQKIFPHRVADTYHASSPIKFGQAVAIFNDWMAVGAPGYVDSSGKIGRVYLYRRTLQNWTLQQTLTLPQGISGSRKFGSGLALSQVGLLVGAPELSQLPDYVFAYQLQNGTWTERSRLEGPIAPDTGFGTVLSLSNDLAAVGLPGYAATPSIQGEVRIYAPFSGGSQPAPIQTLVNPAPERIQRFGGSLASTSIQLLIGARGLGDSGQVIASWYQGGGSDWTLLGHILAPDGFAPPEAGCPVAMADGRGIIGCTRITTGGNAQVHLTVFGTGTPGGRDIVAQTATAGPVEVAAGVDYPQLLAAASGQILAGSPRLRTSNITSGDVLPLINIGRLQPAPAFSLPDTHLQYLDGFGNILAADGDTILAPATHWKQGTVHVFTRKNGVWDISHSLDNPQTIPFPPRPYGSFVAVSGTWMAIASPSGANHTVLLYRSVGGVWPRSNPLVVSLMNGTPLGEVTSLDLKDGLLIIGTRHGSSSWRAGRYRLSDTGAEFQTSVTGSESHQMSIIQAAISGDKAVVQTADSAGYNPTNFWPQTVFDTTKNPWKKLSSLPAVPRKLVGKTRYSPVLRWAGSGIVMATNDWHLPVSFTPSGAAWKAYEPYIDRAPNGPLMSLDATEDLALLGFESRMLLYKTGKSWTFDKELPLPLAAPQSGSFLAAVLTGDSAVHGHIAHGSPYSKLVMHLLASMEVYDGPTTTGQLIGRDYTLPLGAVALDQDTPLPLTLKNTGDSTWTLASMESVPPLVKLPTTFKASPVPPGGSFTLPTVLSPTSAGTQTVTLRFFTSGGSLQQAEVKISFAAQSSLFLPTDDVTVISRFVALGDPVTLSLSSLQNSRSLRFQWFKEGRLLKGDTSTAFFRHKSVIADAGTYELEVATPAGSKRLIKDIRLGIYQRLDGVVTTPVGGTVSLRAQAWGPGVRYFWNIGPDDARVRGSQTGALQILNYHPGLVTDSAIRAYAAFDLNQFQEIGAWALGSPFALEITTSSQEFMVDQRVQDQPFMQANFAHHQLRFTATGLPPGLAVHSLNGTLDGIPTKPGTYRVTCRANILDIVAKPVVQEFIIHPAQGLQLRSSTFAGVIWTGTTQPTEPEQVRELLVPGLMRVDMTSTGTASAQWVLDGRKLAASAKFELQPDKVQTCQLTFPPALGLKEIRALLTYPDELGQVSCAVTAKTAAGDEVTSHDRLYFRLPTTTDNLKQYSGKKTAFFTSRMEHDIQPGGSGFATMTTSASLDVNVTGTLPDGSGITFSSFYLDHQGYVPFCVAPKPGAFFTGSISDQNLTEAFWRRPPAPKDRFFPQGFRAAIYEVGAVSYHAPATGAFLLPQINVFDPKAMLTLDSPSLTSTLEVPFRLTTSHAAQFASPNLNQAKISFYPPTGFFTGSAVVDDLLPGSTSRRLKRTVNFKGMLPGGGFFLLPMLPDATGEPPTTTANSPILSGKVRISPAAE